MRINIQLGQKGRDIDLGSRFSRYFKWFWLILLLWAGTTTASLYVIYWIDPLSLVDLELQLNKELEVKIDSTIPVSAKLDEVLELPVKKSISAEVFVNQTFTIPVNETIEVPLDLLIEVPLDQDINVRTEVPLKAEIPIETTVHTRLPMFGEVSLPVRGKIPLDIVVPVNGSFHVTANVPIALKEKFSLPVKKTITAPIKTMVSGEMNLDTVFDIPLSTTLSADVAIKDVVRGEINQKLLLDKSLIKLKPDVERTQEVKQEIFSKLPEPVRERVNQ